MNERRRPRRALLVIATLALIPTGLLVRLLPGAAGDLGGGTLYAMLIAGLLACLAPRARPWLIGLTAFAISAAIELLQLTTVPSTLAQAFPLARFVLGTTFAVTDLVAYAVGSALAVGCLAVAHRSQPRSTARTRD